MNFDDYFTLYSDEGGVYVEYDGKYAVPDGDGVKWQSEELPLAREGEPVMALVGKALGWD